MRYTTYFVCSLDQLSDERHADTHTASYVTHSHAPSAFTFPALLAAPCKRELPTGIRTAKERLAVATAALGHTLYPPVAQEQGRVHLTSRGSKHGMSPTTTEGGKTRLTRTHWPLGSPSEPHETARALRARLRPPHGPTRPARCRPGLQASGHGPPEADWPKAYLPFYSEPLDDPWLCRHVKLLENRLVPQTYIESDALGRQMYLQAKNSSTCAHEA